MKDDMISRQAAIDALAKFVPYAICDESTESYTNGLTDAYNLICQLPSAQPEIIRCKDCRYWQDNNGGKQHNYCKWRLDETPDEDDFCSLGDWKDGEANENH